MKDKEKLSEDELMVKLTDALLNTYYDFLGNNFGKNISAATGNDIILSAGFSSTFHVLKIVSDEIPELKESTNKIIDKINAVLKLKDKDKVVILRD